MSPVVLAFLLGLVVLLIAARLAKRYQFVSAVSWIPGPFALPVIGNAIQLAGSPEDFFKFLIDCHEKFGGYFRVWVGHALIVMTQDVEFAQAILKCNKNITKSAEYRFFRPYIGDGLLVSTGNKWHVRRKLLTPSFHLGILENMTAPIAEAGKVLVEQLAPKAVPEAAPFDLHVYIKLCALDAIMATSIGKEVNAQLNPDCEYVVAIEEMSQIFMDRARSFLLRSETFFKISSHFKKQQKATDAIHRFSREAIKEKREMKQKMGKELKQDSDDEETNVYRKKRRLAFLDLLLEVEENGVGLTDADIQEEVDTFVFEGHDTTASGTTFGLFLLGHHPEIQERIVEELNRVCPHFETKGVTISELNRLELLDRCIKEALRHFPPVNIFGRELTEDLKTVYGVVPKGSSFAVNVFNLHHDPAIFPEPYKFDPDRFLPENTERRHPFAYIPFSAGLRNCIGQKFAVMEMKILIASVLKNYIVKSMEPIKEISLVANVILKSSEGVNITLQKRV